MSTSATTSYSTGTLTPTSSTSSASSTCSSDDLNTTTTMSSAATAVPRSTPAPRRPGPVQVTVIRCLRCARSEEITSTDDPSLSGMVQIGTNIYYCTRCAKMVGYT
ncbi:hypothetical protein VTJ04DRAFT_7774 [Mycothermus thermophilus]|uniref:uncharacterized protein n=1 Tax=Humicola insolens TaxID=85995 RepID=UPI0037436157